MKFLMLMSSRNIPEHIQRALEEKPHRSGMYNWVFAHRGTIGTFHNMKDNLEDYDVIQVNMAPIDMTIIPEIRRRLKNSSTKLVLNNDYVCEKWGNFNLDPYYYDHIQRMGDMVFGTEPHQVSNMIDGAFCIPHPTNTKFVKRLGSDRQENSVGFIFHWWAGATYLPNRTMDKVAERWKVKTRIYCYDEPNDEMPRRFRSLMWDNICSFKSFPDFADTIMGEKCCYDPNPMHTYGRNGVEMACFKRPIVGSNRVFSYNLLFPELTADPYDFKETMKKFEMVFNEKEKVQKMLDEAYEKVEYFNYKNSLERWHKAFDIATDRGGYLWNK